MYSELLVICRVGSSITDPAGWPKMNTKIRSNKFNYTEQLKCSYNKLDLPSK